MPDRTILANQPDPKVISNKIETAKYNIFTFIPLNLFE